jgi:hypothetical protein
MFGMKVKGFHWKENRLNLAFLVLFLVLIFFLKELSLTAIIVCYMVLSIAMKEKIIAT